MMELPFDVWQSKVQSFPSTWRRKREVTNDSTQTDDITSEEKGVQSTAAKTVEMQTETEEPRPFSAEEFEKLPPSLFAFFSRVTEPICQYLQQNMDPFGEEVFQDIGDGDSAVEQIESVKEYVLKSEKVPEGFVGSCVTWNKAGSQIAVGYSYPMHESWCSHKSPLCSWNIRRTQTFQEHIPTAELFLSSCICCMEFHPMDSTILAVGLYTGEVVLVDLFSIEKGSLAEADTFASKKENEGLDDWSRSKGNASDFVSDFGYTSYSAGHNCQVVAVKWIRLTASQYSNILESAQSKDKQALDDFLQPSSSHCCLLSASRDGFICLWSTNRTNNRLRLIKKFILWADNISEEVKIGNRNVNGMKEIGITQLSCCKDDPFAFIFSTFGSYIFLGNVLSEIESYEALASMQASLGMGTDNRMLFSPSPVLLAQFEGYIIALDCSPFHRNVFLVATSDGRIFIRNLLQTESSLKEMSSNKEQKEQSCITDIQWSPRPMMFGAAFGNSLQIFDLLVSEEPVAMIPHDQPIVKIAFNQAETNRVAVSDENGQLHIWKLPTKIVTQDPHEMDQFLELVKSQSDLIN